MYYSFLNKKDKKNLKEKIKTYDWLLKFGKQFKVKLVLILYIYFRLDIISFILKQRRRLK